MFTGIIEGKGKVTTAASVPGGVRLTIKPPFPTTQVQPGDSIAVNGACLTVAAIASDTLQFDVITETLEKTNLGRLATGQSVNLERSLRLGDRVEGHWVQGHVDATSRIARKTATAREWVLRLALCDAIRPYIVPKGSVAVDGVSLTVADVAAEQFSVALIPTTLERTTLSERNVGDRVNIETDLLVRTVVHNLDTLASSTTLAEKLKTAGFLND